MATKLKSKTKVIAKKPVAKKVVARKAPARRAKAEAPAIKPCKLRFTATELTRRIADAAGIEPKQAKAVLDYQQKLIIASLMKGGIGSIKMFGWNFKSTLKPAVKGGKKAISPFTKEEYVTKSKPASMRAKALAMKAVKDGIAI